MREELLQKIQMLFIKNGIEAGTISSELFMILNDYEITRRCTEVARVEQRDVDFFVNKFLAVKTIKGCTEGTIRKYGKTLGLFFREIPKNPKEVTPDDIRLFIAIKEGRDHCSKVGVKSYIRDVSSFYSWMHDMGYVSRNPMRQVEPIKLPKVKKKAFTDMEIELLRDACETRRETMVVEVLLSTGCRVTEATQIKLTDFDEKGESVLVHGKGQKDRIVYLNARAQIAIKKYMEERKDMNPYLILRSINGEEKGRAELLEKMRKKGKPKIALKMWYTEPDLVDPVDHSDKGTLEIMVRNLGKRAGVEKVHPHRFRRTCATKALAAGMPIEYVSKMLGHESIDTTKIYLDLSEDTMEQMHKKYVR